MFVASCRLAGVQTTENINSHAPAPTRTNTNTSLFSEVGRTPKNIERVWSDFTADGRYRQAEISDMNLGDKPRQLFAYSWGDLNYPKRIEDDHLAVIVVDTTLARPNNFGLVIFSPTAGKANSYAVNWLYREKDLSRTEVHRASGNLFVTEYMENGNEVSCSVIWKENLNKFVCH